MTKRFEPAACQAGSHRWEAVRWTSNYRRCWKCERIEVCINNRWQLPTPARKRRSSSPYTAAYVPMMWTTLIGVSYQDLQVKSFTPLFGSRSAAPASTQLRMTTSARIWQLLVAAGKRGYPDLCVYLPGERRYTINSGLASWQLICEHSSQEVIDGALGQLVSYEELPVVVEAERVGREALVEYARAREWGGFVFKVRNPGADYQFEVIIGESEEDWKRFAYRGYYHQVLEACRLLGAEAEKVKRDAVLAYGSILGWRKITKKALEQGEYIVFGEEGEEAWRQFAGQAPYVDICRVYDLLMMYEGPLEVLQKEVEGHGA